MPKQTNYNVGIYVRLSKDDERLGESVSIENQVVICKGGILPPNTYYDCGSFVVNRKAVIGKEKESLVTATFQHRTELLPIIEIEACVFDVHRKRGLFVISHFYARYNYLHIEDSKILYSNRLP